MTRTLVLHFDALGDLLRATPMLRGLGEAGHEVDLVVFDEYEEAVATSPFIARRIVLPRRAWKEAARRRTRPLRETLVDVEGFVESLRARRYDLVLQIHRSHLAARLAALVDAGRTVGEVEAPDGSIRIDSDWVEALRLEAAGANLAEIYEAAAGVRASIRRIEFPLPEAEAAAGRAFVGEARARCGARRAIGLQVGAGHAGKRWPLDRFVEAGRRLAADGCAVVVHGAAEETDLLVAPAVTAIGPAAVPATGLPLLRAAAILAAEDALLSNDTGPMHLAAAVGTKVLGLFGDPASVPRDRPFAPGAASLTARGFDSIPVEGALAGLAALLDGAPPPEGFVRY